MPLDGHAHLVAQGWSGKGSGLRSDAISRPLAIPQKRTLAGLGKDRDEAFPFWDHLFTVAAKTIQVKIHKDEDDETNSDSPPSPGLPVLSRTSTGILSNRRPIIGTPASTSGTSTPNAEASPSSTTNVSRISLIAIAKRDAARRGLYSRFFRGPVLGPDDSDNKDTKAASLSPVEIPSPVEQSGATQGTKDGAISNLAEREEEKRKRVKERENTRASESMEDEKKAKKAKRKEKNAKGKEREIIFSDEALQERKRNFAGENCEAEDDMDRENVSKKRKKRKREPCPETSGTEGQPSTEAVGDGNKKRSKENKRSRKAEDECDAKDEEQYPRPRALSKEEKGQRKEEKKRRKEEKAEKRRKKEALRKSS